jgi:colanic acid biosynthesis glycosyl transferase WcaI
MTTIEPAPPATVGSAAPASYGSRRLRIQLWSYNYDPEPTGIGIVSKVWAHGLRDLGHHVEVVAAHPHYPEPRWGTAVRPYRELRDGIPVLRLPLWIGRSTRAARYRQELSFTAAQTAATPFLSRPDVLVSASPSFPALLPAVFNVRARRIPWVLWLHDLLPDGAMATGLLDEGGTVLRLSRRLERAAYKAADRIVVLSSAFTDNLRGKGVAGDKLELIYDPATLVPSAFAQPGTRGGALRVLSMGNIGHSQGLTALLAAFEADPSVLTDLIITGTGVAADEARRELRTGRIEMAGLVDGQRLEQELRTADIGFVSQRYEGSEFNIPSKLMNYMAYGLPVLAAVNPSGEVAKIVRRSGGGWVVDSSDPSAFPQELTRLTGETDEIRAKAAAARLYAEKHFTTDGFSAHFERVLIDVARRWNADAGANSQRSPIHTWSQPARRLPVRPSLAEQPSSTDSISAVLLDRDGVINRKLAGDRYVTSWDEFEFLPGTLEAISRLSSAGMPIIVVTNQRGIARGHMTVSDLLRIHELMQEAIASRGGRIDAIYFCPHDGDCDCRKPAPGLLQRAARDYGFALASAVLVGDRLSDMQAAAAVGATAVLVASDCGEPAARQLAAYCASGLGDAVTWLLASRNSRVETSALPEVVG